MRGQLALNPLIQPLNQARTMDEFEPSGGNIGIWFATRAFPGDKYILVIENRKKQYRSLRSGQDREKTPHAPSVGLVQYGTMSYFFCGNDIGIHRYNNFATIDKEIL